MFVWLLGNSITLFTLLAVLFATPAEVSAGGFTRNELITYYVLGITFQWLAHWYPFYSVEQSIKDGSIVGKALLKPISYFWSQFAEESGWHTISVFFGLTVSVLAAIMLRDHMVLTTSLVRIIPTAVSTGLAIMIVFTLSLCLGLLGFWLTYIRVFDSLFWVCRAFFGGAVIPLSFLPGPLLYLAKILPFRYLYSFPLEIYMGKVIGQELVIGIFVQLSWVFVLVLLYNLMWRRGLRFYTAFGN